MVSTATDERKSSHSTASQVVRGEYPGMKDTVSEPARTVEAPRPTLFQVVPCSDGAGDIVAVGEGVRGWSVGDRVMGNFTQTFVAGHYDEAAYVDSALGANADGMLTQYKILPHYGLVRIPDHLSFDEASTLPCAGLTAWNALYGEVGNIVCQPGHTVVLLGTGGVSCFGAQFAIAQGAQAIITSSSDDKLESVAKHISGSRNGGGAGVLITHNYKDDPDWEKTVLKHTKEGAEHVLEVGGPGTVEKSFAAVRQGGVITSIGFVGSKPGESPPNISRLALFKGVIFRGILIGNRRQFEAMCNAIAISKMKPLISATFDFEDAKKVWG
ncbi:hypothetical protein P7C73_g2222, partial [Tremellales sp. Uapishka_1]